MFTLYRKLCHEKRQVLFKQWISYSQRNKALWSQWFSFLKLQYTK